MGLRPRPARFTCGRCERSAVGSRKSDGIYGDGECASHCLGVSDRRWRLDRPRIPDITAYLRSWPSVFLILSVNPIAVEMESSAFLTDVAIIEKSRAFNEGLRLKALEMSCFSKLLRRWSYVKVEFVGTESRLFLQLKAQGPRSPDLGNCIRGPQ